MTGGKDVRGMGAGGGTQPCAWWIHTPPHFINTQATRSTIQKVFYIIVMVQLFGQVCLDCEEDFIKNDLIAITLAKSVCQ